MGEWIPAGRRPAQTARGTAAPGIPASGNADAASAAPAHPAPARPAQSRPAWRRPAGAVLAGIVLLLGTARLAPAQPGGPLPDLSQPIGVDEVVRIALERNLSLARAGQDVAAAQGGYVRARAGLLPTAVGQVGYNQTTFRYGTNQVSVDNSGRLISGGFSDNYGLTLSGRQNLVSLPVWYSARGAAVRVEGSRDGLRSVRNDVALQVKQRYYAVYRAQELAKVSRDAYALRTEQLRRAESLFALGSVARSDVLQAQVNVATAERERIAAENAIEQERARLAMALALPVDSPVTIENPGPLQDSVQVENEETLFRRAEAARPDLRQQDRFVQAARYQELTAKAQRYPAVSAGYSYSKDADDVQDTFHDFDRSANWGFNVGLSLDLFDGFATKGDIQQATANRRADERTLDELRLQVALEVRESLLEIKNASEGIRSAREGVALAEESARLQRALYEAGGGTLLEWNNAQVELTRARTALIEAEVNLRLAQAGLENAVGQGGE